MTALSALTATCPSASPVTPRPASGLGPFDAMMRRCGPRNPNHLHR